MNSISKVLLKGISIATRPSLPKTRYSYETRQSIPSYCRLSSVQLPVDASAFKNKQVERYLSQALAASEKANRVYEETIETDFLSAANTQTQVRQYQPQKSQVSFAKGLPNQGNTCFIASVIQASLLFKKSALEEKLKTANETDKKTISAMLDFIQSYEESSGNVRLDPLLSILRQHRMYDGSQEDAAELLTWLTNYLPDSPVYFHQIAKTEPLKEGEQIIDDEENRSQYVREIPLEVEKTVDQYGKHVIAQGQTLLGLLKKFFSEVDMKEQKSHLERLVMSIGGGISERKIPLLARKEILSAAPSELTFQIKKFQVDHTTGSLHRIGGSLTDVPETFTMPAEYCANGEKATYRLRSVVSHHGTTLGGGHYTAYVRKGDSYVHADDSRITVISKEAMLQAAKEGYILIYDKIVQQ